MCDEKYIHIKKNLQNIPHYIFKSQIITERFKITKLEFYTQFTNELEHVFTRIGS
jgi:hypothetical protein